ncbi:hypothetical protein [Aureispira sp. CCB-QB1]|uniref:hypothetical protein n=1 Tax=Aureispira sp. CCB-QB1 TaxID=1313421 RepID=UPI0006982F6B|nr:hypothetical protein [Aureispira sp. CCB-QB1]
MENLKQTKSVKAAKKDELKLNLGLIKARRVEMLNLLSEMSILYFVDNNDVSFSDQKLSNIRYQLDIMRGIIVNA